MVMDDVMNISVTESVMYDVLSIDHDYVTDASGDIVTDATGEGIWGAE